MTTCGPLRSAGCVLAFALAMAWVPRTAVASSVEVRTPHGGAYTLKVTSLKEARFRTTVPQQYDFSCGSAATATLLTYQYGHPVSEKDVAGRPSDRSWKRGDLSPRLPSGPGREGGERKAPRAGFTRDEAGAGGAGKNEALTKVSRGL